MGTAEDLKKQIESGGRSAIEGMVIDARPEDLHVEYKTSRAIGATPNNDDCGNYAKSLSGFSNADGGILVWGISCQRKDDESIAVGLEPLSDAPRFKQELDTLLHSAVARPVDGVENMVVLEDPKKGFVVPNSGRSVTTGASVIATSKWSTTRLKICSDAGRDHG